MSGSVKTTLGYVIVGVIVLLTLQELAILRPEDAELLGGVAAAMVVAVVLLLAR